MAAITDETDEQDMEERQELKQEYDEDHESDNESGDGSQSGSPGIEMKDIYYVEVVGKEQKDKQGPYTYQEFKTLYQDKNNTKLNYMSPIWNGLEISEWTQIFKIDHIFKDLDPERYNDLKNKSAKPNEKAAVNVASSGGLAQPKPLKEYREQEAEAAEKERLNAPNESDRPIIEKDASYQSSSCCTIL